MRTATSVYSSNVFGSGRWRTRLTASAHFKRKVKWSRAFISTDSFCDNSSIRGACQFNLPVIQLGASGFGAVRLVDFAMAFRRFVAAPDWPLPIEIMGKARRFIGTQVD